MKNGTDDCRKQSQAGPSLNSKLDLTLIKGWFMPLEVDIRN